VADINLWAVLVGAIASGVLGALWYSPLLFLRPWTRAAGREPAQGTPVYAITALTAIVAAATFGWWAGPAPSLEEATLDGLVVGLLFVAPALAVHYAFVGRGFMLWLIDGGFQVARFTLLGVVFGLMG
jgi:hypothetical protein